MKKILVFILFIASIVVYSQEKTSGESEGLLITKSLTGEFIEFIADGTEKPVKYIPEWVGGNPKDGGGFNKETIEMIKKSIAPNRILLKWKFEEHLRVLDIKIIVPEKKEGSFAGSVSALGDTWIEVKGKVGDQIRVERFMPRWLGKDPKEGGGLDKEILKEIGALKIGDTVSVNWVYDERKRALKIFRAIKD